MKTSEIAERMSQKIDIAHTEKMDHIDSLCWDGEWLLAAIKTLAKMAKSKKIIAFYLDSNMINSARIRLPECSEWVGCISLRYWNTTLVFQNDACHSTERERLAEVDFIIGYSPYGKNLEMKFFELCDKGFIGVLLVFLMPISFADCVR